jgi:transposase-like protein
MKPGERLSEDQKQQIVKLVKRGSTGVEIAKQVGCSTVTVQNVKKAAGLVKSRRRKGGRPGRTVGTGTSLGNLFAERERLAMALAGIERKPAKALRRERKAIQRMEQELRA